LIYTGMSMAGLIDLVRERCFAKDQWSSSTPAARPRCSPAPTR
jgi:hypothetical protein